MVSKSEPIRQINLRVFPQDSPAVTVEYPATPSEADWGIESQRRLESVSEHF